MKQSKKITLIAQSGQYEQAAVKVVVKCTTQAGLNRRINQLRDEHAVYGDNWAGWIKADIAIANKNDRWFDNNIIGGQHCDPANGWIDIDNSVDFNSL